MSRQASLDLYFKCKSSPTPVISNTKMNDNNTKKRRNLSLIKTPTPQKANKTNNKSAHSFSTEEEAINLCSDDETNLPQDCNPNVNLSQNSVKSVASDSSEATIIYDLTPKTPKKSPQASSSFSSPTSREKFYSPIKKRNVLKKTSIKRNLVHEYNSKSAQHLFNLVEDEDFTKACEGMDDKSIFLLTIIYKCLKNESLKLLLDDSSTELLSRCLHLVKPGMSLVCRLFWRKNTWYTREKLMSITNDKKKDYSDVQFQDMLNCLVENRLVVPSTIAGTNAMTFEDFTKILTHDKLKQICKDLKLKIQSKQDGVEALRSFSKKSSISNYFTGGKSDNLKRVIDIFRSKVGTCYKLSELASRFLRKLYLLMYLGMNYEAIREKKLELMLINDKIKRETYPVDKAMAVDDASVVFRSRIEFEQYFHAHLIYEEYLTVTDTQEKCVIVKKVYRLYKEIDGDDMTRSKSLPPWLRRFTPANIYVKILESGIQELKKAKYCELALDILSALISQLAFRQHKKAEWFAEKALVLHKLLGQHDEAAEVLLGGLKSDLSEEAKDAMRPRANKIASQQNITLAPGLQEQLIEHSKERILENTFHAEHLQKQHMELHQQRGKKKFEVHTDEGKKFVDAEDYCVIQYTSDGAYTHGEHWEGRIVTTIYFLLFWDIIYTKPRGAVGIFLSHYQLFPLDMYSESFYVNRRTLIDDRLEVIENMDKTKLIETLQQKWEERPENELSGINRNVGWDNVRMVATCLGPKPTAALCRRLAADYGYAHSGFPDLTLWNTLTGKIKFVEVKTDTDKPSTKQLQWMRYLRDNNIDTGFCYVGVSTTRCKARAAETPAVDVCRARAVETPAVKVSRARAVKTPAVKVKSVSDINRELLQL